MRELTEAELDIVSGGTEPEGGDEVRRLETVTVRPDDRNGGGGSGGTLRLPTVVVTGTSGGSGSASFGGSGFPSFPSSWFEPDGPVLPEADLPSAGDLVPPTPKIAEPACHSFTVDGNNYTVPADWNVYQPNPNVEVTAQDAAFLERSDGSLVVAPWHEERVLQAREALDKSSFAISSVFGAGGLGASALQHPATSTFGSGVGLIATITNPPGIETVGPPEHECEG